MLEIFSKEAPAYWEKGISVIPLRAMQKRPVHDEWTQWCNKLPDEETKEQWLRNHTSNNIGLALGEQSKIVVVDIDTYDKHIEEAILSILPVSPWKRVGKKGCVLAYRYNGEKTFQIIGKNDEMLVEVLSSGRQVVLPPSIHPDTGQPYECNVPLVDVYDTLPLLGDDIQGRLRAKLSTVTELRSTQASKFKSSNYVGLGARDNEMVRYAGLLSVWVIKGEHSLLECINLMIAWTERMVQKVNGDAVDVNKGVGKIIEFVKKDIARGKMLPPGWDDQLTPDIKLQWGLDFGEDQQEWTSQQLHDYISSEFMKCESPTDQRRHKVVQFVLERLAKSTKLKKTEEDMVIKNLKDNSGLNLPTSSYTKELNALKKGPISGDSHDEIAEAVIKLYEERNGNLAYHMEKLWEWKGSHWAEINQDDVWTLIANEFGSLNLAKRASDHKGIIEVIKRKVQKGLSAHEAEGVNFANGFLTPELKLMAHQREHGMTYVLDFQYKPEEAGNCPRFMSYLLDAWGHHPDYADKIMALRQALAVTIFGKATSFQRAFLLYDAGGGTGKSQLAAIVSTMVPEYAQSAIPPDRFHDKYNLGELEGKLFNFAGEISNTKYIDGSSFKAIVAGDTTQGEHKYLDLFQYKPKAAHWFCGNCLPKTKDVSHGFNRRWLIFTFDRILQSGEIVRDIGESIAHQEREAIAAWAVEVFPDLMVKGDYVQPESHKKAVDQMAKMNSNVRQWVSERIERSSGTKVDFKTLYQDYFAYQTLLLGNKHMSAMEFDIQMTQILHEQGTLEVVQGERGKVYLNISLKAKK